MRRYSRFLGLAALSGLVLATSPAARAIPSTLSLQGFLTNASGAAQDGSYTITVSLWSAETGGTMLYDQTITNVLVEGGLFDVVIGTDPLDPLLPTDFTETAAVWMQVELDAGPGIAANEAPLPRRPLTAAPFAFAAQHANSATSATQANTATTANGLVCSGGCVSIGELDFDPATQAELNAALTNVVTTSALNTALAPYAKTADLAGYVTSANLTTALQNYVTSSGLTTTLAGYVSNNALSTALGGYVSSAQLTTALAGYVSSSQLTTALQGYVSSSSLTATLADYVKTSGLAAYVSDTELSTALQSYVSAATLNATLADYAKTADLPASLDSLDCVAPNDTPVFDHNTGKWYCGTGSASGGVTATDLSCSGCVGVNELGFNPATQTELDTALQGYATTASLSNYVTSSGLSTTLQGYATTSSLTAYATVASLSNYVTSAGLATALSGYVTAAGLNTTLADYAKKSDLPTSVNGLAGGTISSAVTVNGNITASGTGATVSAASFVQNGKTVCDSSGNCGRTMDSYTCADGEVLQRSGSDWKCATVSGGGVTPPTCQGAYKVLQWSGSAWSCIDIRASGLSGGKARGFEVTDAWGYAWDGEMRPLSTWANANATCIAEGGRLPTVTELTRVNHTTGNGGVGDGLETNWHWALTPIYAPNRYMVVRLDSGANSWSANAAETQRYRCVWPNRKSEAFDGNDCYGPPGNECFGTTAEGGRYNIDKFDRPAVPWWVAVNECAFYNARLGTMVTYAEAIQAGLPNGSGVNLWSSDRAGYNSVNFLMTIFKWTNVQTAFDGTHSNFVTWGYNTEGTSNRFRCVGLNYNAGTYPGTISNEFVDVGRSRMKSTTTEPANSTWVAALDACFAQGGHIPTMSDWTMLIQSGLPRPNNADYSWTADAEYGDTNGSTNYNAIITWKLSDLAWTAVYSTYSTWGSRGDNNRHGRCVWYPIDATYAGPSEDTCNGGCFKKSLTVNGVTHNWWMDKFDRTPAKLGDAIRTCYQNGGHLPSHAEWAEMIRQSLPNGSNTWSWTSDWARYDNIYTIRWTGTQATWDNLANTNGSTTAATTTAPYRCIWSNELDD